MSDRALTFTNEDGTFKTKEQFLSEAETVYDNVANSINNDIDLFEVCTSADSQIDAAATLTTYETLTKSINICEEVTSELANKVIKLIRFYNQCDRGIENPNPIFIFINTDGGELHAAFSIISAIEASTTPVYTINLGKAFSAGFLILISGHKRFGMAYADYLFHEGANCAAGDAHKVIQSVTYYEKELQRIKDIVLDNTCISEELYEEHKKDDWWFGTYEAIDYNVIDKVINTWEDIYHDMYEVNEDEKEDNTDESDTNR